MVVAVDDSPASSSVCTSRLHMNRRMNRAPASRARGSPGSAEDARHAHSSSSGTHSVNIASSRVTRTSAVPREPLKSTERHPQVHMHRLSYLDIIVTYLHLSLWPYRPLHDPHARP